MGRIGAGVGQDFHAVMREPSLRIAAAVHADAHGVALHAEVAGLRASQVQAHAAAGLPGQQRGNRLHREFILAAIRAAHGRAQAVHALRRQRQHRRNDLAFPLRVVVGKEQPQAALAIAFRHAAFGLEKGMHLARGLVAGADAMHRGRIGGAGVAKPVVVRMQQIAARMQFGNMGRQSGLGAGDSLQQFVLDGDQIQRRMRDIQRIRGHGRDGIAHIAHAVAAQRGPVHAAQSVVGLARNVGVGDHRVHAGKRACRSGIDAQDAGMRVRAAQDRAAQLVRRNAVRQIQRHAAELGRGIAAHQVRMVQRTHHARGQ